MPRIASSLHSTRLESSKAVRPCERDAPKYMRVREQLMEDILSSGLTRGDKLPSENDLVAHFDVSRVTIRQALEMMRAEGILESRRGKGWFLRRIGPIQNLGKLQGFGEMLAPMGVHARSKVLECVECPAPDAVSNAFGLPENSSVIRIARLRIAGGRVMSYDLSYFPLEIGRQLMTQDLAQNDIFVLLERSLGLLLGFADVTIEMSPVDAEAAERLAVKVATPVFKLTRLTHDSRGFPIDFEYVYGLPESQLFKVRVPRR
jgi:GntR family transcriptional regulator